MSKKRANILEEIVEEKNKEIKILKENNNFFEIKKHAGTKKNRGIFKRRLGEEHITVIAEIKKASPSKGIIAEDFNPLKQLKEYIRGGAGAISVLTDKKFFQGGPGILRNIRRKTDLPILRKDFIMDPVQVYQSFDMEADIILLIAAILEKRELNQLINISYSLGMEALVEVHDEEDLKKVVHTDAEIIGINNRNLNNFTVDIRNSERIINILREMNLLHKYHLVAESGIKSVADIKYLQKIGVDGVLIGEALMKAGNPAGKICEFSAVGS
ncbi:MAG: indole-3-glycerol phosphate synthase TrpC [Halanaerobiaceae bacterium]